MRDNLSLICNLLDLQQVEENLWIEARRAEQTRELKLQMKPERPLIITSYDSQTKMMINTF